MGRWMELSRPGEAPDDPGVYVFIWEGKVVLVGSTSRLRKRLYHYSKDYRVRDCRLKVRPCQKYGEWLMVELRLIHRLKPLLNSRPPLLAKERY